MFLSVKPKYILYLANKGQQSMTETKAPQYMALLDFFFFLKQQYFLLRW